MKALKRIGKLFRNLGNQGYTLIEVAAVVGVTATMIAVAAPVVSDITKNSKFTSATQDVGTISAAIAAFYKDTGFYPGQRERSSTKTFVATSSAIPTRTHATGSGGVLDTDLNTYLVTGNNSSGTGFSEGAFSATYPNWKGPYMTSKEVDPWGKAYLFDLKGVIDAAGTDTSHYGWVISAGQDLVVQQDFTSNKLTDIRADFGDFGTIVGQTAAARTK